MDLKDKSFSFTAHQFKIENLPTKAEHKLTLWIDESQQLLLSPFILIPDGTHIEITVEVKE